MTDIEGSTRLSQQLGAAYPDALLAHHRLLRTVIAEAGGIEVKTEGDSFFVLFASALDGLRGAAEMQRRLAATTWPGEVEVRVRMGLHVGEVSSREGEYVGVEIHRAARIGAVAHGGQIVASEALREEIGDALPEGISWKDLGEHRLKDFDEPEHLFQVNVGGLRTDFPPLSSLSARFELLPPELTEFVGREELVARLVPLVGQTRLLTMTGPGGTGKTRLAVHLARTCEHSFQDGAAFVPLAPIRDEQLLAPTIRSTLGFAEEPGRPSLTTLTERLRHRHLLMVLDNFEQLIAATPTVTALLSGTAHLTLLVTSRSALHLEGEQEFAVPPLAVPTARPRVSVAQLAASESVRLFVDRARQVRPDFRLDEANAAAVAEICRRLDGLPLAIELAAARVKLLSPTALLARLSSRLEMLSAPGASAPDRHRTLRGTIDWSHDLLLPTEQTTYRRMAIFNGGGTLEAIETLVADTGQDGAEVIGDVLDALAALVDHSLVRVTETERGARYGMLETIREYGLERLAAAGEDEAMSDRHAHWILDRVHQLAPGFTAGPQALDEIEAELENLRAAMSWSIRAGRTQPMLEAVSDLWRFWHLRGHLREGLAVCDEVVGMPGAAEPSAAGAGALYAQASLKYWQGESAEALDGYLRSLEMARQVGATAREAEAEFALAYCYGIIRDFERGHRAARRAAALYETLGDHLGNVNARSTDAYLWALEERWQEARTAMLAVDDEVVASGDRFWIMNHHIVLAWTLTRLGEYGAARVLLRDNLEGSIELGDRTMEHVSTLGLAALAALDGDTDTALRLAGAAEVIAETMGGVAPTELVVGPDPVAIALERGVTQEAADALIAEGRALGDDSARALTREIARRGEAPQR